MRKVLIPFIGLVLIACGQVDNDLHEKTKDEAIILQDSALKILKQDTGFQSMVKAIALLDKAIEKNPRLKSAYFHKMNIYKEKGDEEAIFATLIESNEKNPGDAFTTLNLGIEYELHGDITQAAPKYDEAVLLFESVLDTLPESEGLIRNTYVMNFAMAKILANQDYDLADTPSEMDADELENFRISLKTFKSMNRKDLLNIRRNKHSN